MRDKGAARWLLPMLAAIGLLLGAEVLLRGKLGALGPEPIWGEFDFYYSDINMKFFRLIRKPDGSRTYVTNRPRAEPQQFLAEKPKGVTRIFVVGGSVAIDYARDQNRIREFLRKAMPRRSFEVIGCGMGGYDSFRDAMIQEEVLGYSPDAIVLMSGNNEFFSPETMNPTFFKLARQLRRFWLFRAPVERWSRAHPAAPLTLQDRLAHFESNLRLMARRAKKQNVPMIFCTLPANIRDTPPLRSKPRYGAPGYLAASDAFEAGDDLLATRRLERYLRANPSDPFGHYWLAKSLDRGGFYSAAREHYLRALDLDDPGERCSPARNAVIRRVAREEGMIVADLEGTFDAASEHHLPDSRIFLDPVHWRGEYYPLVSWTIIRSLYDDVLKGGSFLSPASEWEWAWLGPEREKLLQPRISRESQDRYADTAIYKAMTFTLQAHGKLSEGALALFELAARRDPARLDELTESFDKVRPALETYPWLRPYEQQFKSSWPDIVVHVGEAYRRQKDYRKALSIFDAALRSEPGSDLLLLLRARTLWAMGRAGEARSDIAAISADAKRDPAYAYWCGKIAN
jgi:tetratricopeptide (TPR) repeat protein